MFNEAEVVDWSMRSEHNSKETNMQKRKLGNSNLEVSAIGRKKIK